jgi:hypothetical protein
VREGDSGEEEEGSYVIHLLISGLIAASSLTVKLVSAAVGYLLHFGEKENKHSHEEELSSKSQFQLAFNTGPGSNKSVDSTERRKKLFKQPSFSHSFRGNIDTGDADDETNSNARRGGAANAREQQYRERMQKSKSLRGLDADTKTATKKPTGLKAISTKIFPVPVGSMFRLETDTGDEEEGLCTCFFRCK